MKVIKKNCRNCHFCFAVAGKGWICAGNDETYGKPIEECIEKYPDGCINWDISLSDYCDMKEN